MPQTTRTPIAAFVFDAYGTLFDVYAVGVLAERLAPGHGADLARLWRTKQLEYTWLQSLMAGGIPDRRENFDRITAKALDFAVEALALPFGSAQKQKLRDAYFTLTAFPDALATLAALAPRPRWILYSRDRVAPAEMPRDGVGQRKPRRLPDTLFAGSFSAAVPRR